MPNLRKPLPRCRRYCREPFMFIMQLMIPCSPPQSLTITWTAPVNPMTADMDTLLEHWAEDEQGTVRAFFTNFKRCGGISGKDPIVCWVWWRGTGVFKGGQCNGRTSLRPFMCLRSVWW